MLNELYIVLSLTVLQFKVIFPYWIAGTIFGSVISVFASSTIINTLFKINTRRFGLISMIITSLLGAASPICMYGTIPLIASLGRKGLPQHLLASFMVSSILLNPNLFIFSFALGTPIALIRLLTCILSGVIAGLLVKLLFKNKTLFDYRGFQVRSKLAANSNKLKVFFSDLHRGLVKTAPYFLIGILLTALLDRYIKQEWLLTLFEHNRTFGVLMAASLGVPVYVCGGGTIPLIKTCLSNGMSIGAGIAFMISGPATKLTNLSAVKAILGINNFVLYIVYSISFSILAGLLVDMLWLLIA